MAKPISLVNVERFWGSVDKSSPDGCWPWLGDHDRYGYGEYRRRVGKKRPCWRAHRVSYELTIGPIPDGLVIDHLCRNRGCVNPSHMEPVTSAENIRRGMAGRQFKRRTEGGVPICKNGHKVIGSNARPHHQNPKLSVCVQCRRDGYRRWRERHGMT